MPLTIVFIPGYQ
jgi:hypothetical protein